jgi:hypothetical protein
MNPQRIPGPRLGGTPAAGAWRGHDRWGHLMLIRQTSKRLAAAGHLMSTEIDAAADLIGRAYTDDSSKPVADKVVHAIALASLARTVVRHAAAHGTVLRPTAPQLRDVALAVWLPAEAPALPDLDPDLMGHFLSDLG